MPATNPCAEMELLIQADIDGELSAAEVAAVTAHRNGCEHCARVYRQLLSLKQSLRSELTYHSVSPEFRLQLQSKIAAKVKSASLATPKQKTKAVVWFKHSLAPFGVGAALAASLMLFSLRPAEPLLLDAVVAEHIRSLQPGHLLDVESSDQHNVKPWFDGKLDFSPPVKNFAAQGFPLVGGRLDYLNGREVAALIYQRGKHPINVFVWPDAEEKTALNTAEFKIRNGYNVYQWKQNNMVMWIVSDLNQAELSEFVKLWNTTML